MSTENVAGNLGMAALIAALLLVGGVGWWFQLQPDLRVEPSRLSTLPMQIDGWKGRAIPVEETVEKMLDADFNLQRSYHGEGPGELVWLYIGYYGTTRGGRPEHTPAECYPSAGWRIESEAQVAIDPDRSLRANEYVVSREGDRRLVHFWYRSYRSTGMLGTVGQSLDRLRGRLSEGRADGALVRVSTPVLRGREDVARERLRSFARRLDRLLDRHWPVEFPAS